MEIKVKYQIGQHVWVIVDNEIREVTIHQIETTVGASLNIYIMYYIIIKNKRVSVAEAKLFATKEELIKSL
ncbi:MAG: hypothetical protein ABIP68_06725 [Ferruginibacter sp.]